MITISNYYVAKTLEDAYITLNKAKNNTILGGCMWIRMGKKNISTAIDIQNLGLNLIEEEEDFIKIGAMATLSDLEHSELLMKTCGSLFKNATHHIVGTQFRNTATVGGSIFGRYGFSDILTAFLPLNATVKTYAHGEITLVNFCELPYEKDIIEYIKIPKKAIKASYKSIRNQSTDFPVLTVCAVSDGEDIRISVGSRPKKAELISSVKDIDTLSFGSNMRGSAEYRRLVCKNLIEDALLEV